jgi:2'-hydroxyisoflavone reductase
MTTRRQILKSALIGSAAAALGKHQGAKAAENEGVEKADARLKILILGGTGFLGPHLVERAQARGHTLTLFNRGKTRPGIFPDVEKLRGDRKGQLDSLKGRKWDAVIDNTAYVPRLVKLSADILAPNIKQYVLVSSISVFAEDVKPGADESAPVQTLPDPALEDVAKYYGPLKAACEKAAEAAMQGRVTNIRPGLIVGPGDPTDRYSYWPVRIDRGGEALAPGTGKDPVQYIDARDLATWMIHCLESKIVGVFNATGPERTLSVAEMLESCRKASEKPAALTWADEKFLEEQKVGPWGDMPVWTGSSSGFSQINCAKAIKNGLRFRSAEATARDTLAWWKTLPEERRAKLRAGISAEREKEVLAAWKARKG